MPEEQSSQPPPNTQTSVEATTQPPPNSSSTIPPPVPAQSMPALLQMGIGISQNSLSPDAIRAYNEFLIQDSNNRLQALDNDGSRKLEIHKWYLVVGAVLIVLLFFGVGVLAYWGHEDLAKTIGGAILLIIAGAFGGYGVGKKG